MKKQQVIALGKLGWALQRIEQATGVRRASANPANEVTTDPVDSNPANAVTTDFSLPIPPPTSNQDRITSACEPFREWIKQGLSRGRLQSNEGIQEI